MKRKYVLGGIAVAALILFGVMNLKKSITPYVSFDEARTAKATVQINGSLVKDSINFDTKAGLLNFSIADKSGKLMPVVYPKSPPSNLATSTSVVVIGTFKDGAFRADEMLVKCPSKYVKQKSGN